MVRTMHSRVPIVTERVSEQAMYRAYLLWMYEHRILLGIHGLGFYGGSWKITVVYCVILYKFHGFRIACQTFLSVSEFIEQRGAFRKLLIVLHQGSGSLQI